MTLEECMEYIETDECIEVTLNYRLQPNHITRRSGNPSKKLPSSKWFTLIRDGRFTFASRIGSNIPCSTHMIFHGPY